MNPPSESSGAERRQFERTPVTLVVEYQDADDLIEDYTANLSVGGMFVHTERDFASDTPVDLVLSFPGLLKPVRITGMVRWASRAGSDSGIGIEFSETDGPEMAELRTLVESLKTGDSRIVGDVIRLLLVEDNPHVQNLIEYGLRQAAHRTLKKRVVFEFTKVQDGERAIEVLNTAQRSFDMAIVDMYLPVMHGSDVVRFIRDSDTHASLPVVAVSSGGDDAEELAKSVGCNAFLDKPFRLRELLSSVERILWP